MLVRLILSHCALNRESKTLAGMLTEDDEPIIAVAGARVRTHYFAFFSDTGKVLTLPCEYPVPSKSSPTRLRV